MPTFLGVTELVDLDALQVILFFTNLVVLYSFHSFTSTLNLIFSFDKLFQNLSLQNHSFGFLDSVITLSLKLHVQRTLLYSTGCLEIC